MSASVFGQWLLPCLFCFTWLYGQSVQDCRIDASALHAALSVNPKDIQPGTQLYLSQAYLDRLDHGHYTQTPSELRCYLYVRPASNKELRKGKIKGNSRERIGRDDNVYVDVPVAGNQHFFEATEAFTGQYQLEWRRQDLLLPLGLRPLDVQRFAGYPLKVLARQNDFFLLEAAGRQIVFYRGYPPLNEVFDTEAVRQQLVARRRDASTWLGRPLLMLRPHQTTQPPMGQADAWVWAKNLDRPLTVQEVLTVDRQGVTFGMSDQRVTLRLSDTSQWQLYDATCVDARKTAYLDSLRRVFSRQEVQLEAFAALPATRWADNADLRRHLAGRFGPVRWPDSAPTYYYLLQPEQSTQPHLYPQVHANGNAWLVSHYLSEAGLYHTRLRIFVGRDSLETERVSTIDQRSRRSYRGSQVIEEIAFDQPGNAPLVRAIAQAGERPVRVKFIAGGDFFQEARLPALYRSAIRDAWMWAQTLRSSQ